jgi:hypothetical protein
MYRQSSQGVDLVSTVPRGARRRKTGEAGKLHCRGERVPIHESSSAERKSGLGDPQLDVSTRGVKEQRWLHDNWRAYVNRWVALDGGLLIAESADARKTYEAARALEHRTPFMIHVTPPEELPFGGW